MRVLVLYAHPVPESFGAAVHETVVATLRGRGTRSMIAISTRMASTRC